MTNRIGSPELKNQYPIWAWYQYRDSHHKKPDLRGNCYLPKGTNGIRIEFEKEINQVVLSDFVLWHYPLSYKSLIAQNEAENNNFELRLKKMKLDKTEYKQLHEIIKIEIEKSWERIFDMEFEDEYYTSKKDSKTIQACCWEIKEDEIIKIDKFKAR